MNVSVCLSVRSRMSASAKFSHVLPVAVARSSSDDDDAIYYVLPVSRMTSCFDVIDHLTRDIGNARPTYSPGGATLFRCVVEYNGSNFAAAW